MEELDYQFTDIYLNLKSITKTMQELLKGIRNAIDQDSLVVWQKIADMLLEYEISQMNGILKEISGLAGDDGFQPVELPEGSLRPVSQGEEEGKTIYNKGKMRFE